MEKTIKKKRKIVRNTDTFKVNDFKNRRINHKGTFRWIKRGNSYIYDSERKRMDYLTNKAGYKGIHIVAMVKAELKKGVKNGTIKVPRIDDASTRKKIIFFNKRNVIDNAGKEIVAVDFKRCYWTTLYLLGYISEKLYKKGLSKSEYKMVCNMSIGSLAMNDDVQEYENGVLVNRYKKPSEFAGVRLHVISRVYKVAMEIINQNEHTRGGFLWFLTDCFFVVKGTEKYFYEALLKMGYQSNIQEHEKYEVETKFRRQTGSFRYFVKWDNFEPESILESSYNFNSKSDISKIKK